jgi:hypothetical protein
MFAETSALNSQALFDLLVVEPRPIPGGSATAELPETIRCLPRSSEPAKLTFIFTGRLAGLPTSVLWDGGASTSFVDSHLVAQHSLSLRKDPMEVRMANGTTVLSPGTVKVHLAIQNYSNTVTPRVLLLTPGYGVILGDDWARRHHLLVDYGDPFVENSSARQPSLLLRIERICLVPASPAPSSDKGTSDMKCNLISAKQAKRFLKQLRLDC